MFAHKLLTSLLQYSIIHIWINRSGRHMVRDTHRDNNIDKKIEEKLRIFANLIVDRILEEQESGRLYKKIQEGGLQNYGIEQ